MSALRQPLLESLREVRQLAWAIEAVARLIPDADDPLPLVAAIVACAERAEQELTAVATIVEQASEGGQQ